MTQKEFFEALEAHPCPKDAPWRIVRGNIRSGIVCPVCYLANAIGHRPPGTGRMFICDFDLAGAMLGLSEAGSRQIANAADNATTAPLHPELLAACGLA